MKYKILTLFALSVMLVGSFAAIPALPMNIQPLMGQIDTVDSLPDGIQDAAIRALTDTEPGLPDDWDIGLVLQDQENNYKTTYEPWKTKAAIHAVAYHEETGFLALAGGYLYDNEVHIFRLNIETGDFDKVWDIGSGIIGADVMAMAWGDTDLNDFLEVAVASADGHVYLFEQRHIYDPLANTENMFDHVWTSPDTFRAFDVEIADVDLDYRADLIIGGWDGKVRCFEYDNHSGYPFSPEHWITFREVWNSGDTIDGKIYTLATGDTNHNGLPEIIVGTREGIVYVFENDGITMMINGEPFPLINDNHYYLNWTSANYTWRPIMSMTAGELDDSPGEEIALVAQGQGVFILNWDTASRTFMYERVYRDWDAWQTSEESPWRLDFWADSVVSANNVTYLLSNGTAIPEPIAYRYLGGGLFDPDAECYPYNTGMANESDGYYSTFDASPAYVDNATAVIDFGNDEEGTGSASSANDIRFKFQNVLTSTIFSRFNISVSQDGTDFEQVDVSRIQFASNWLHVDVDDALGARHWDWFRYIKVSVYNGGLYSIDSIELIQVYTQLTTALTVTIGPLPTSINLSGPPNMEDRLIIATVMGNIYAYEYGSSYDLVWDSSRDDFFTVGANVWDMAYVQTPSELPIWAFSGMASGIDVLTGFEYQHYTIGDVDPNDDFHYGAMAFPQNLIVINSLGDIWVYEGNPEDLIADPALSALFALVEPYNAGWSNAPLTIELAHLFMDDEYLWAAVGSFNPEAADGLYGLDPGDINAGLQFYRRPTELDVYDTATNLKMAFFDETGALTTAIQNAKTVPRMHFVDWDNDNDQDMVLSTGFLYYCENIGSLEEGPMFLLHPGFFAEMNERAMNCYWGQPQVWDMDEDGDWDIILSYDGRNGATYWENEGSNDDPSWTENKKLFSNTNPDTNMKFMGLTDIRIVPNSWGMQTGLMTNLYGDLGYETLGDAEYTMWSVKPDPVGHFLYHSWPVHTQSVSYVFATYPTVYKYDFAITAGGSIPLNLGYHVSESWSTEFDLKEWTLSITSGDIDGDGNGEIIVGDYDNNVYIFEHMINNTYKRAFRSFDINHTETSDTSPYYWEELGGISGEFQRVIWDHVKHVVADCDIDGDGYKELVAAAGLQVYIFEDTGIDDTYKFVHTIDFRDSIYNTTDGWDLVEEITAIGAGDDIDLNGMNELVVAAGPFLFIYNVPHDAWNSSTEYFMDEDVPDGTYYLVGNGAHDNFLYASIETMTLCDTDEDGFREVIIGGRINVTQVRQDGFLKVYEWRGAAFAEAWEAPHEVTKWNPVTSVILDDQDYDSNQEIIIGHMKGFDIWEWNTSISTYQKVEVVTASPNYPIVPLVSTRYNLVYQELYDLSSRGQNDIEYGFTISDDFVFGVFVQNENLYWKYYVAPLDIWSPYERTINTTTGFNSYPSPYDGYTLQYEVDPALFLHENGTLYLTWTARFYDFATSTYHYDIWITRYTGSGPGINWDQPVRVAGWTTEFQYQKPKAFMHSSGTLGVAYFYAGSTVNYRTSTSWGVWSMVGFPVQYVDFADYHIQDFDIINTRDGGFALAIAARNDSIAKTDYDIYVATSNSSFIWQDSRMYAATSSYNNEINPDIHQLDAPEESLVVVYESAEAPIEDRIQMSYGSSPMQWHQEEPMNTLPSFITRVEEPEGVMYYVEGLAGPLHVISPMAYSPTVMGLRGGGFMYSFAFDFFHKAADSSIYDPADIRPNDPWADRKYTEAADWVFGINPSSRFTHFNIGPVVDLAVGDTDGDARREVVAGFEDRVGVYELKHSNVGGGIMEHEEAWLSLRYDTPVTGVTVYDTNGNGWEEIGISCRRGDVFVLEIDISGQDTFSLMYSQSLWNSTTGAGVSESSGAVTHAVAVFDIDGDGKDEIVRGEQTGTLRAFDDDGSLLWTNSDFSVPIYMITIGAMTPTQHYIAVYHWDGNVTLHSAETGNLHWRYDTRTFAFGMVAIGDVMGASTSEVVVVDGGAPQHNITVLSWGGSVMWERNLGQMFFGSVVLGNFSGRENLDIAVFHTNGTLTVMYGNNGTTIFRIPYMIGLDYCMPAIADLNNDGYDEIISARNSLWAVDPQTQAIVYNSSSIFSSTMRWLFVEDFDNDSFYEAVIVTNTGVYYEEFTSGGVMWSYEPQVDEIDDAMLATFADGRLGIALCTNDGAVIALDAMTGVPVWFDMSSNTYSELAAGDFDGDGLDEIAGSATNGDFYVFKEMEPQIAERIEVFGYWSTYWNYTLVSAVESIWVHDINGDGITEYAVAYGTNTLTLFDPLSPTVLWNISTPGIVREIQFGNLRNDMTLDLLMRCYDGVSHTVIGVDGATGIALSGINHVASGNNAMTDIALGNFSMAIPGNEYLIVYEDVAMTAGIAIYDTDGGLRFVSSTNTSSRTSAVTTGYFDGDTRLDIAIGGRDGNVFFYTGLAGHIGTLSLDSSGVYTIDTGNFNSAGCDDVVVGCRNGQVTVFDPGVVWPGTILWQVTINGTIDSVHAVDVDQTDPEDEAVVNVREVGLVGYSGTAFVEEWQYDAPTVIRKRVQFLDVDSNSIFDIVLNSYGYVAVIDSSDGSVFGAYAAAHGIKRTAVGNFDDNGILDLMLFDENLVYVVSNSSVMPPVPLFVEISPSGLLMAAVTTVVVAVLPVSVLGYLGLAWKKRRRMLRHRD